MNEEKYYIVSESELTQLLRADWLVRTIGTQAFYQVYKKSEADSIALYFYTEERLKEFFQYNPKLP